MRNDFIKDVITSGKLGDYAILKVGNRLLKGMKYDIPYTWCMLFYGKKPKNWTYSDNISSIRTKLHSVGLTLENVEKQLHILTGIAPEDWQKYRQYSLNEDEDTLQSVLIQQGYDVDDYDAYLPNTIFELEILEETGPDEMVFLYRMLLAIESEYPSDVQLDISDFDPDFRKDKPFDHAKESFVNKITAYEYLFTHAIDYTDRQTIILEKIGSLNEDQLTKEVLIPLFGKMQFFAIKMISHHGPNEFGRDLYFYKVDDFGRRIYYAAQVKSVDIHTNSRRIEGNASAIANQLDVALQSETIDEEDNVRKQIDNVMLITSKEVNHAARLFLHKKFRNRELTLLDGKNISKLIEKYQLNNLVMGICVKSS